LVERNFFAFVAAWRSRSVKEEIAAWRRQEKKDDELKRRNF
jgi:hypothetical protein